MFAFASSTPLPRTGFHSTNVCPTSFKQTNAKPISTNRTVIPKMVLYDRETIPIKITGNNIHITESLRNYINEKLSKLNRRFSHLISKLDVHLTVEQNHSVPNRHKAEVVAFSGKTILRKEVRSDDMYAAIDSVEERINRTIRKFKERKERKGSSNRDIPSTPASIDSSDDEEEDGYADVYQTPAPAIPPVNAVVKRKVFPMPMQTVEEAVLCCEYVDHPWYLFRNAATKEISLVYKRNHGGYGLIEPSNPDAVDETPL